MPATAAGGRRAHEPVRTHGESSVTRHRRRADHGFARGATRRSTAPTRRPAATARRPTRSTPRATGTAYTTYVVLARISATARGRKRQAHDRVGAAQDTCRVTCLYHAQPSLMLTSVMSNGASASPPGSTSWTVSIGCIAYAAAPTAAVSQHFVLNIA